MNPTKRNEFCPNAAQHTPGRPAGYVAGHEWAEEMAKTHTLTRCKGCRLWLIWTPKKQKGAKHR